MMLIRSCYKNSWRMIMTVSTIALTLAGCGGGGGGGGSGGVGDGGQILSQTVSGGGVKGPLANAAFALYQFDSSYINFQSATSVSSGRTDSQAKFSINIPKADLAPPYILVFTADANTTDLMTGGAPLITEMKTVVTQAMLDSGANIYATPLTTMAVDVAIKNSLSNVSPYKDDTTYQSATTTEERFLAALPIAAQQVKSTLGFGLGQNIDIYTTPPIVDSSTNTTDKLNNTAQYRGAVEALAAVVNQISTQVSGTTATVDNNTMVQILTADLEDGKIDGKDADGNDLSTIISPDVITTIENTDPQKLTVPGTTLTVDQMTQQLADETTQTGNTSTSTTALTDSTITISTAPAQVNPDRDGDGVLNSEDAFPDDATESKDTDGDGIGDNTDPDIDGDGVLNENDADPLDATVGAATGTVTTTDSDGDGVADGSDNCPNTYNPNQKDLDNDGTGDACDSDIDGDGHANNSDAFPIDSTEWLDTDRDGLGNNADTDDDNDGVLDVNEATGCSLLRDCDGDGRMDNNDAFPLNPKEWVDSDGDCGTITTQTATSGDGCGNNSDLDDDNDGVPDTQDAFPLDATRSATIVDSDGDGIADSSDNCPTVPNTLQIDTDQDGQGNACDTDDDNDGVPDTSDVFPLNPNESADTDKDGVGDNGDNCPAIPNAGQLDTDQDGQGNVCDSDDDNDGVPDTQDAFPLDATESVDTDGDGIGNNADTDDDNDGVLDVNEASAACALVVDCDGDGFNDNVDAFPTDATEHVDTDSDGVGDNGDNCPTVANATQLDTDSDGQGDACDTDDDNDGVPDTQDAFPLDATESVDTDGDGIGNNADTDDDGDGVLDTQEVSVACSLLVDCDSDGVGDATDNCPAVANPSQTDTNGNGIGDACDTATSGAYSMSITTTAHTETTEPQTGYCWSTNDQAKLNVPDSTYISVATSAGNIIIDGNIAGTVNADGTFTATQPTKTRQESYYDSTQMMNVNFTVNSNMTLSGTVTGTTVNATWTETDVDSAGGSMLNCSRSGTAVGSLAYAPTGSENYSSVYAIEASMQHWDKSSSGSVTERASHAAEFIFDGTNGKVAFFDGGSDVLNSMYDPVSGHFEVSMVDKYQDTYDWNGDGNIDLIRHQTDLRGVMFTAPNGSTPEMWIDSLSSSNLVYFGTSTSVPPAYTGQAEDLVEQDGDGRAYGKMVSTADYNNVFTNPSTGSTTQDQDFLGLRNPPLQTATPNSMLYFEAYDGSSTASPQLCSVMFSDRYSRRQDLPAPDFTTMAFRTTPYSFVNCPLASGSVVTGNSYTLVVRDDNGTPGDTTDDIEVLNVVHTATPSAAYPGVKQDRRSLSFNGALPSQTEADGFLMMNGYFNLSKDMTISWPAVTGGVDQYTLRLWDYDPNNTTRPKGMDDYRLNSATNSVTLPANSLHSHLLAARLMTRYSDTNSYKALSQSKHVAFAPGLNGMVNVEMLETTGTPMIFQMAVLSDDMGHITCTFTQTGGDNCTMQTMPDGSMANGFIDFATDTVTIYTTAGNLSLVFSDAVNATATLGTATGNAKVVTSEMNAKTRIYAAGTPIVTTQVYLTNASPAFNLATLAAATGGNTLDGTNASLDMWDNSGTTAAPYFSSVYQFFASDWDGVPAMNGTAASYDTKSTTTTVLADDTYKIKLTQGGSFGLPDMNYSYNYVYTDPSALAPPLRTLIAVDGTPGTGGASGTGTPTTPLALTGTAIGSIVWQSTAASTTEWQVMIRGEDTSNVDVPGQDIRTSWMEGNVHANLSVTVDSPTVGTNTWTWTNPGIPTYPYGSTGMTGTAKIVLRVRPNGDGPIEGIAQPFFVTAPAP